MKKLTVFTTQSDTDAVIRRLMQLRCVDIEAIKVIPELLSMKRYSCEEERTRLSESIKSIDNALKLLHKRTAKVKSVNHRHSVKIPEFMKNSYGEAMTVVTEANEIGRRLDELDRLEDAAYKDISALTPWERYDLPLSVTSTEQTSVMLGCMPGVSAGEHLRAELKRMNAVPEIVHRDEHNVAYLAVIAHKAGEREVSDLLSRLGFTRLTFKELEGTAAEEITRLESELVAFEKEADRLQARLSELARAVDICEMLRDVEATALAAAENKQKLLSDGTVSMLSGWIPERTVKRAADILERYGCAYDMEEPSEGDDPPVLLRNNPFAANFQWVVGMYSYPKYGRFDPTFVMSIFYFLIFGIMFADVGYGLLTVLGCFGGVLLLKPKPGLKRSMMMFGYCGISSIIFGAVFGGWFGDMPFAIMTNMLGLENAKQIFPFFNGIWFNPIDDPIMFLVFALAVGFVHIIAGMAVRFYILCRDRQWMDAVCETFPWWIVFAGAGVYFIQPSIGLGTVIFGLLFVMFAAGRKKKGILGKVAGGLLGLYDIVNYFSDILSYSRILALGLASAVIAQVVNLLGTMGNGFMGYVIMVVVFIIGHLMNLAINLLGTFVHTSRLQYLEFFGRFFEDGGRPFNAAEPSERYSEISEDD